MRKLKYTITAYQNVPKLDDFEAADESDLLTKIKQYIEEDPSFVIDGLDQFSIQTEIVEEILGVETKKL